MRLFYMTLITFRLTFMEHINNTRSKVQNIFCLHIDIASCVQQYTSLGSSPTVCVCVHTLIYRSFLFLIQLYVTYVYTKHSSLFYMHYVHDIIQSEISDAFIRSTNNKHTPRYKDMWRKESCNILLIQLLHNINDKIIRSFL